MFDPILLSVLKSRIEGIVKETAEVILRASRNPILYSGKDFTCTVFSYKGELLTMTNSIPVHIFGMRNSIRGVIDFFGDDVHPGDAFVNCSPYHGNNHVGDWSMFAPIFYEGELIAWAASLCHLIDSGAYRPTNLDPFAKDIFEEGIHFPPVRLIRDHKEIPDLINLIKANFRYSKQWHGDFLAQVGSLWTAEREILKLCKKYGGKVMKELQDELIAYGDRRMTEEIRKLPKGTWEISDTFERIEPHAPNGLRMHAKVTIDPDEALITFDLTGMDDQRPWGYNCSRSTAEGACIMGSMPSFDPTLPRNDGVYRHFRFKLREGAFVGIPKWPVGTSCATFTSSDETAGMILRLWEKVLPGRGHAAGGEVSGANCVSSGVDFRRENQEYGYMYYLAMSGGPASKGIDGYVAWLHNGAMGNQSLDSVELVELSTPIVVWEVGVAADSGGAGQWRGAPGLYHRIQPRNHTAELVAVATGFTHEPLGVAGGDAGRLAQHWIEKHGDGTKVQQLSNTGYFQVQPDEDWVAVTNGGGGYGDPLDRDPEAVRDDARNLIVSLDAARNVYGVVLRQEEELFDVDYRATENLRSQLREARG